MTPQSPTSPPRFSRSIIRRGRRLAGRAGAAHAVCPCRRQRRAAGRPHRLRRPRHRGGVAGAQGRPERQARRRWATPSRTASSRASNSLQKNEDVAAKIDVPPERRFVGFDAYKQVIDSGDVVLLGDAAALPAAAPGGGGRGRQARLRREAGGRRCAGRPRACWRPARRRRQKNLSVVSGLCLRYDKRLPRDGQAHPRRRRSARSWRLQANDYRGPIWVKPRQPDWSDMDWQMRNWYYFTWLSGDFNVEQHVHFLDVCAWVMKDDSIPCKAVGMGGRQVRTGPEYGHIYDHFSVVYEYADGAKLFSNCRQQAGCDNDMSGHVLGTKGTAELAERKTGHAHQERSRRLDVRRPGERHLPDRARRAVRQHPQRQADQQRRVHGQEHAAGDHGPHGRLHRPGDHLGHGAELEGRPDAAAPTTGT